MSLQAWLTRCPLVAILRGITPEEAVAVADALLEAGFAIIEVPLNSPQPLRSIERLVQHCADRALVGAGTVTTPGQVDEIAAAGAKLLVSPHADAELVRQAKHHGLIALPGCATPTEAFAMLAAGADGLKLFPAEACPPNVLRALRAVLPQQTALLPVGSITPENMAGYWQAGASGFGLGGALYRAGDSAASVANKAQAFMRALKQLQA